MLKSHKISKIILLTVAVILLAGALFCVLLLEPAIPIGQALDTDKLVNIERTVTILDDEGLPIGDRMYANNKRYVSLSELPEYTKNAFIAIEDKRFYKHKGIDWKRVAGAAVQNIKNRSFREGASTITQQLIKNTHLSNEKTIHRKITEMRIARDLERKYTKDEILEIYLNILYFGNSMYGIGSASHVLFDKKPQELTVKESAILAGIINNPYRYSPYNHPDATLQRGNLVLKQMVDNGFISQEDYQAALSETVDFERRNLVQDQYVNAVIRQAAERIGIPKEELFKRQYTIATYTKQTWQNEIETLPLLNSGEAEGRGVRQYRVLVTDNQTGAVLASTGYGRNDISALRRQPGSTLKPVLCYAPALENDTVYPITPILDEKTTFGDYAPSNYKDVYYGWVTLKDALKYSLNIPAVKMLEANTVAYAKSFAQNVGIDFDERDNSLALAVGGMTYGVTLEQIAGSFQTFGGGGKFKKPTYIRYIADRDGKLLYRDDRTDTQAMRPSTAFLITDMLQECAKTGTAKLLSGFDNVAAKTGTVGTAEGNSDAYCVAYTPQYTIAVWCGGEMDNGIAGGTYPTRIVKEILTLLDDRQTFACPPDVTKLEIDVDALNNEQRVLLAGPDIPLRKRQAVYFAVDHRPQRYSTVQNPFWDYEEFFDSLFDNYQIEENCDGEIAS